MAGREPRVRRALRAAARYGCACRTAVRDAVDAAAPAHVRTRRRARRQHVGALRRAGRVEHRNRMPRDRARGRRLRAADGFLDRRRRRGRPARAAAARMALGAGRDSCGVSVDAAAFAEGAGIHRCDEAKDRRDAAAADRCHTRTRDTLEARGTLNRPARRQPVPASGTNRLGDTCFEPAHHDFYILPTYFQIARKCE
ncbi:hypothetical protein EMIT0111MI5_11192 [Burkholderia sp. IT-111MI5]